MAKTSFYALAASSQHNSLLQACCQETCKILHSGHGSDTRIGRSTICVFIFQIRGNALPILYCMAHILQDSCVDLLAERTILTAVCAGMLKAVLATVVS